ncbi:MAG TPA: hypothetical protein VEF53_01615 [Patescibacteria group bacterium]|nr:hypothetical protein [Patescibacteria group bacterium]
MVFINLLMAIFGSVILISVIVLMLLIIRSVQRRYPLRVGIIRRLWGISFAFTTVIPLIIPIKVINQEQFEVLKFGLPFRFIEQHTLQTREMVSFPFYTTFINPWGHSIAGNLNIRLDIYIFSVICVYLVIYTIAYMTNTRKNKDR